VLTEQGNVWAEKNPEKPNKQSILLFARILSWWFFYEFEICYGAANKVVKQDLKKGKDL